MNKKYVRMAIAGCLLASAGNVFAAEAADGGIVDEYTLDDVIVTATRSAKKDVDVPAATAIVTDKEIHDLGATNAADAISRLNGVAQKTYGARGAAMGTMINEINIRGVDNGTLVLVNGNPVSWRGKYNLQEIPADDIERIEVVKGGGSVLYGSEAMAGVVNIITKHKALNQVKVGIGNRGQQLYNLNVGGKGYTLSYNLDKFKRVNDISFNESTSGTTIYGTKKTNVRDIKNTSFGIDIHPNDNLNFIYKHYETTATYDQYVKEVYNGTVRPGDKFNYRTYETIRDMLQLNYHDKNWKGSLYFNSGTVESKGMTYISAKMKPKVELYNTREKNVTYGTDLQRTWNPGKKSTFILGGSLQHEIYQKLAAASTKTAASYMRNNWGFFGQWEQRFDDKNTFIFGARETFTQAADGNQNYNNFSMSGSYVHKFTPNNSIYLNIAQSFIMPTFAQMYGASSGAIANPGLKPQKGINYELGWKQNSGSHTWKAALFHITIKDNISATWNAGKSEYSYNNEDFKNTGVELSCDVKASDKWGYNYGITYQNPLYKSDKKGYWDRKFGKIQLTAGVKYKVGKFKTALTASYLSNRVISPSAKHSYGAKPYLLTTLTFGYQPTKLTEFNLSIENLLNRRDVVSHSAEYYNTPFAFMFSITQKF